MIVLFPLWRRRWRVKSVLDSDDRLDAARSLYWHAVMNRPNKLVILCKRARVLARSDHPETMPIQVEPGNSDRAPRRFPPPWTVEDQISRPDLPHPGGQQIGTRIVRDCDADAGRGGKRPIRQRVGGGFKRGAQPFRQQECVLACRIR